MGNWVIVIEGIGCHHNPNLVTDADKMTKEFVKKLKDSGHYIHHASFHMGGQDCSVSSARFLTECCNKMIGEHDRFCPACGHEARVMRI